MTIMTASEKMAYDIGFDIGHSNDEVQSKLLNGLFKPFREHTFHKSTQMSYIADKLDENAKEMIIELAEYAKGNK